MNAHTLDNPATFSATQNRHSGFTLLEVLLVVALLAGLLVFGAINVGNILQGGQENTVRIFVNDTMKTPLFLYQLHNGRYPTTEEGLNALMIQPSDAPGWKGSYVDSLPKDPWGRDYRYVFPGKKNTDKYDIFSLGSDGVESADDIGNW